jgi:NhaP-type Na+/H+ or K+/H+ antiporter
MDTLGFAVIATGVILFGLVSKRLESTVITPPMVFTVFGLIIGEAVFGVADLDFGHGFIHGLAELTLILVLFSDAARIDVRQLRKDHNLPVRLLLIGMPLTIAAGTLVAFWLPIGLSFWEAALLAAILAPTDAALGQSVVSSSHVPVRIRQALNVESGLNDGIALPVILLFATLVGATHTEGPQNWALFGAKQVILGPLAGIIVGGAGAWLLDMAAKKEWITESYEGAAVIGTALLAYSGAEIIDGNGFIAAFVGGLIFGNFVRGRCGFVFEFAEAEGQILVLLTFLIFGAAILPHSFGEIDWVTALYAILSLTVIRMLPVGLSLIGSGVRAPTVAFLGWFGPRGLASMLFALFVLEEIPTAAGDKILIITIATVSLSILAHGLSAAPAARRYGDLAAQMDKCEETKAVSEMPTRVRMNLRVKAASTDDE